MSKAELKRVYGALSKDLRQSAQDAGGARGLQLFERANQLNSSVAGRREKLAEIVGSLHETPRVAMLGPVQFVGQGQEPGLPARLTTRPISRP
jgi:type II secretory pathway component PulJ